MSRVSPLHRSINRTGRSQVKGELVGVSEAPITQSYARLDYHQECEAAVNEQINIEYTISYVYHSLYAFFDRDNVGVSRATSSYHPC